MSVESETHTRSSSQRWAEVERLLDLGCELWQGHQFSAPLAPVEFEALLKRAERRAS